LGRFFAEIPADLSIVKSFMDREVQDFIMTKGLLRSIIILPGSTLVFIPALLLWVSSKSK